MSNMPTDLPENDRALVEAAVAGRGWSLLLLPLLLLALFAAPAVRACSTYYEPGQTPRTPYAEVAAAPIVVEARVIRPLADDYVEFAVKRVLRGTAERRIRVSGRYFSDLRTYGGWLGECFHDVYQAGATYLLLVSPDDKGGYSPNASPLQFAPGHASLRRAWVEWRQKLCGSRMNCRRISEWLPSVPLWHGFSTPRPARRRSSRQHVCRNSWIRYRRHSRQAI
ncbi:hypothetical protein [Niveispirillum cyanobacteriorum]|uniref:hypothetical protein n=1 Tax=Niveispirillum cyanobacteriorum TaxID=1612173 RepID=UPI00131A0840|nr:hypothetical protein [Niveispirillum cyanobacteriorum]